MKHLNLTVTMRPGSDSNGRYGYLPCHPLRDLIRYGLQDEHEDPSIVESPGALDDLVRGGLGDSLLSEAAENINRLRRQPEVSDDGMPCPTIARTCARIVRPPSTFTA